MYNVLITEPKAFCKELIDKIPDNWNIKFKEFDSSADLVNYCATRNFKIIFCRIGLYYDESLFNVCKSLEILATPTTGLDHIHISAAEKKGIKIISIRQKYEVLNKITSTAEHAWTLLLSLNRNLIKLTEQVNNGFWDRGNLDLFQLSGKKLGIIGYGRLGKMIARYGQVFGMSVYINDLNEDKYDNRAFIPVSLDEIFKKVDHLILAASYKPNDKIICTKERLFSMKKESTFINISRGELVDEDALVESYKEKIITKIGLDVLCGDSNWPRTIDCKSELVKLSKKSRNIIITPHIGGYAHEAVITARAYLIEQVINYLNLME